MAGPQIPNLFKIPELRKKILLTLGVLVLLRVGAHITVPGVDRNALTLAVGGQNNLFGLLDLFTGGALQRATVFALGVMPLASCPALDPDIDGRIAVAELVEAVANGLNDCAVAR